MEDEACVHEAVLARVAGRAKHEICFGLLIGEGNGSCAVGKTADNDLWELVMAQTVMKVQLTMRKDDRIWGIPKATLVTTGQSSEKLPAGRR